MKPTVTNARYRVETLYAWRMYLIDKGRRVGCVLRINRYPCPQWIPYFVKNPLMRIGVQPTAQAAMDALVAAYEGNGEAGE